MAVAEVEIDPAANSALEGLYMSGGRFCTQCEAEGFRRITWFLDRPDVMATYTVTLRADKQRFPVLATYDNVLKCSHLFNLLDARGAISVTERVGVIKRVRDLAVGTAKIWNDQQTAGVEA